MIIKNARNQLYFIADLDIFSNVRSQKITPLGPLYLIHVVVKLCIAVFGSAPLTAYGSLQLFDFPQSAEPRLFTLLNWNPSMDPKQSRPRKGRITTLLRRLCSRPDVMQDQNRAVVALPRHPIVPPPEEGRALAEAFATGKAWLPPNVIAYVEAKNKAAEAAATSDRPVVPTAVHATADLPDNVPPRALVYVQKPVELSDVDIELEDDKKGHGGPEGDHRG